jgi:hypothetical protein
VTVADGDVTAIGEVQDAAEPGLAAGITLSGE